MIAPAAPAFATEPREALRLWLRLFTCTTLVEREVDAALKREFGSSLARFDVLAQLDRAPEGLRMGALSERTLTTNGNITWLVAALERDGLVRRRTAPEDRRAAVVRLTPAGRRHFAAMAAAHEHLIARLLGGLTGEELRTMHALLGTAAQHLQTERTV